MNYYEWKRWREAEKTVALDEEATRKHRDGTPCHARPDNCPLEKHDREVDEADEIDAGDVLAGLCDDDGVLKREASAAGVLKDVIVGKLPEGGSLEMLELDDEDGRISGEMVVANPFDPVDYRLGGGRGYRDVWEDEAEMDDYRSRFSEVVDDILESVGLEPDDSYDYGSWETDRMDGSFVYRFNARFPEG